MKRLLALLLMVVAPAFAQEYTPGPYIPPPPQPTVGETGNIVYTTVNPPPSGTQYTWSGFINTQSNGGGFSGGNTPAYNPVTGTFLFGYTNGTINYNITNSPEWPSSGVNLNGFKYSWEYFNQDFSRGSLTGNISLFSPNNSLLQSYSFGLPKTTQGWTLFGGEIDFASPYDRSEIGRLQVSFTGKDDRFWAGYYGPQLRNIDVSFLYDIPPPPPPPPPSFLYWDLLAGENGLFTLDTTGIVRYGAQGSYLYAEFQPGTYACTNGDWGNDPIGGVVKSCEFGSNEPPPSEVVAVDCVLNPSDTSCIIDTLTVDTTTDPTVVADTTVDPADTGSDDGSDDGTSIADEEEETMVASDTTTDPASVEQTSSEDDDEELADDTSTGSTETTERLVDAAAIATYRELSDDDKASVLADSIAKNVLEGALSIASEAASTTSASSTSTTSSDSSSAKTVSSSTSSSFVAQETSSAEIKVEEQKQDVVEFSAGAIDALETGRQLGKESLASVTTASEQSATDSINQAESIAAASGETQTPGAIVETKTNDAAEDISQLVVAKTDDTTDTGIISGPSINQEIQADIQQVAVESDTQQTYVADTTIDAVNTSTETNVDLINGSTEIIADTSVADIANDTSPQVVADTQTETTETFADVMAIRVDPATQEKNEDFEFVQQVVAQSQQQTQDDTNNTGFSEDEKVTITFDPALANAFNVAPNITNLEVTGVLNQKQEEKSDAEKAADKVVAANAKEQEEINKNYMDADQSGIVAAIGADTDVTSYRTAMIRDNNNWYKPEDIYKNVVYKDNVRGAYFLEKGNTDTYKKMVGEQYK